MTISSIAGTSLPLWQPDEEILADNINLRERRYGGQIVFTPIGTSDLSPVLTFSVAGHLYGSPIYGFLGYSSAVGAGLITDTISISEVSTTITTGSTFGTYGPNDYGFISYGSSGFLFSDTVTSGELSPITSVTTAGDPYGSSREYGFTEYLATNFGFQEIMSTGEISPTISIFNLSNVTYGSGRKWGFFSYVA